MPKSDFAKNLDTILAQISAALEPLGFQRRARVYNRVSADGLTQVVHLEMAKYWQSDYGRFTVNLGVYVPEVNSSLGFPASTFVQEPDCTVRCNLGGLLWPSLSKDEWWSLSGKLEKTAAAVIRYIREDGIILLDRYASREAILREWARHRERYMLTGIAVAAILAHRGELREAADLLRDQKEGATHWSQRGYIDELAVRLGLGAL